MCVCVCVCVFFLCVLCVLCVLSVLDVLDMLDMLDVLDALCVKQKSHSNTSKGKHSMDSRATADLEYGGLVILAI